MDVNVAIKIEAWAVAEGLTVDTVGSVEARILRSLRGLAGIAGFGGLMHWNNEVIKLLQTIAESAGDATSVGGYTPTVTGGALIEAESASAGRTALGLGTIATQAASAVALTGGTATGVAHGARTTSAGTDTIVLGDVNGAVVYGASSTVTITTALPTGSSLLIAASAAATLTWAVSGGESVSEATTTLADGEGRMLVKVSATAWRLVQSGSAGLTLNRIAFACTASGLVASVDTSTDGGATWTTGTQVAADVTSDTDSIGATVGTSGISVPTVAGAKGATIAACQRWTWYLDGTGGLQYDVDPAGVNRFLQMAAQGLPQNNGSAAIAGVSVGIHVKSDVTKGIYMGRRIDGASQTLFQSSSGSTWNVGGTVSNKLGVQARVTFKSGVAFLNPDVDVSTTANVWTNFTNFGSTFGTVTALSVSVLVNAWQAGSGPHVIPFSGSFSSSVVG